MPPSTARLAFHVQSKVNAGRSGNVRMRCQADTRLPDQAEGYDSEAAGHERTTRSRLKR